jgi:GDP-L-fucose synthase
LTHTQVENIVVTGGGGMMGHALRGYLSSAVFLTRSDFDLEDLSATLEAIRRLRPTVIVHLAALVAGIQENVARPYDFVARNTLINTHVIQAAIEAQVQYIIAISSTCAYPGEVDSYPMVEEQLHAGPPAAENLPYGYAKRLMSVELDAADRQFGLRAAVLYASNLYGPHDDFDARRGHLVAALIRKVHEAKVRGDREIQLIGTGRPKRQFLFADDLARVIASFVALRQCGHFNVAPPEILTVDEIAATVQEALAYPVPRWYSGTLDGQYRKDASSARLLEVLPEVRFTSLEDGVKATYAWYCRALAQEATCSAL